MPSAKQELCGLFADTYINSLEEQFNGNYEDVLEHLENEYYVGYRVAEEKTTGREWSSMMPSYNKDQARICRDMWLRCAAIRKKYFPEEGV